MDNKGHISSVASFASTTSSSNMNTHLSSKHNISVMTDEKATKIVQFLKPKDAAEGIGALSNYEVARKMVLWFCRDLMPFEAASKEGFMDFFSMNVPYMHIPSTDTLRKTALDDIFQVVRRQLKERLSSVRSICLMFDGWTDRYRVRPYLGIRISYLCDWKYEIATLGCYVLPSHTGRDIANLVTQVLKEYFPDLKKIYITSSHDGAKNVVLASKLLKVEYYQHCLAHVLHLLLSADSINNIPEVAEVVQKCRNIVTVLHFKSHMVDDELAASDDKRVVDELVEKMSSVSELLDIDQQIVPGTDDAAEEEKPAHKEHRHQTLKAACPTRWNSLLVMLESIVQLQREVDNALKRNGNSELRLHEDELDVVKELVKFLKPFQDLTYLISSSGPTLSLLPFIKAKIRNLCTYQATDDERLTTVKNAVLNKLDARIPDTDEVKLHQILDPDTKDLIARPEATALLEQAIARLTERGFIDLSARNQAQIQAAEEDEDDDPVVKNKRLRQEMLTQLRLEMPAQQLSHAAVEVAHYLTAPSLRADGDILAFWKKHCNLFPHISQLANILLSSSASSVPVECMFSTAGLIANSKRSSLSADKLHKICFIHDNYNIVML